MSLDLVLKNAKIVTPTGLIEGDVGILGGKIHNVGRVSAKANHEIDCSGLYVLPGLIDMHVHFREPGFTYKEDFASGSAAAAASGVTTFIDMPNTNPPTFTNAALQEKRAAAAAKSTVNFGFYIGFNGENFNEIQEAKNIAGVKLYMGQTTGNLFVHSIKAIEELFQMRKFVVVHAEDYGIINENEKKYAGNEDPSVHSLIHSSAAAYEASKTALHIAKKFDAQIHITHVSTFQEVDELRKFQSGKVTADCTPHHLYLAQSAYADRGNFVKVNPPVRTNKDRHALWEALRKGIIQVVATDHAPHTKAEKERPYKDAPAGVPGIETLLPLLLDTANHGEISLRDVVKFTSANPAALLGIKNKGRVEAGFDADLAVIDMNKEMEVGDRGFFSKCGWSPFSGWRLKGWPVLTLVKGKTAYKDGIVDKSCRGEEVLF